MAKPKPVTIFRLKVTLLEGDSRQAVWRVLEMDSGGTLYSLHKQIFKAFDREDEHSWSFSFGTPGKRGTVECTSRSGRNKRLNQLPFASSKSIYYLFDYGDEWMHRLKFEGEFPAEEDATYPRITKRHGESPPQYDELDEENEEAYLNGTPFEFKAEPGKEVSFAEVEQVMRTVNPRINPCEVIGVVHGALSGVLPVSPLAVLHDIGGDSGFLDFNEVQSAVKVIFTLHNQFAEAFLARKPFALRRMSYPDTDQGVIQRIADLRAEIKGFVHGLGMGVFDEKAMTREAGMQMGHLAELDNMLEGWERLYKRKPNDKTKASPEDNHRLLANLGSTLDIILFGLALEFRGQAPLGTRPEKAKR
ncbi:plasmid pRiA4b ORF-3 family protein [bacterium]|nr:plasmid pRiA4b ORF-3 family protein [bacterium]